MAQPLPVSGPTWRIVNIDNPLSSPIIGQFNPNLQEDKGAPIWVEKPGIMGGQPWLKYVGRNISKFNFEFNFISHTILDQYPLFAWNLLNELGSIDSSLGRPPRILFTYGTFVAEGFITAIPPGPIKHWAGNLENLGAVRQIGPVTITVTRIPRSTAVIPSGTNFVAKTADSNFEELARRQYGNARYSQTLAIHNQGVKVEETLELPRLDTSGIEIIAPTAAHFDDPIDENL